MSAVSGGNLKLGLKASISGLDILWQDWFVVCTGSVQAVIPLEDDACPWREHSCRTGALPKGAVLVGTYTASSAYHCHLPHCIQMLCAACGVSQRKVNDCSVTLVLIIGKLVAAGEALVRPAGGCSALA